jgi:hypothetical protein
MCGKEVCLTRLLTRPGRTGRLPTRSPHRPGRAQLRHPVPQEKDSLSSVRVQSSGPARESSGGIHQIGTSPGTSWRTSG